mmetsp:Transcript_86319/g.268565  ORF Transcript_86319/g.268565 Transcript_86319/m.268565 type:complete len:278 (+) Transcript_86319:26-859(+)
MEPPAHRWLRPRPAAPAAAGRLRRVRRTAGAPVAATLARQRLPRDGRPARAGAEARDPAAAAASGSRTNKAVMLSMPRPVEPSLARFSRRKRPRAAARPPRPRGPGSWRRRASTVAWLPLRVSQTPSQARRTKRSAGRSVLTRTSGTPEIICFSGSPCFRVRLYAKSASARLRFRLPSILPSEVTQPPAASTLARSSLLLGLWSFDMAVARPRSSQSTQRESPQLATCSRVGAPSCSPYSMRATTAVQPMPSGLSAQRSSKISIRLRPSASRSPSIL